MNFKKHNERGAGRKPLPPDRKRIGKMVYLIQSEIDYLEKKFGSVRLAVRSLIINKD